MYLAIYYLVLVLYICIYSVFNLYCIYHVLVPKYYHVSGQSFSTVLLQAPIILLLILYLLYHHREFDIIEDFCIIAHKLKHLVKFQLNNMAVTTEETFTNYNYFSQRSKPMSLLFSGVI